MALFQQLWTYFDIGRVLESKKFYVYVWNDPQRMKFFVQVKIDSLAEYMCHAEF